MITLDGSTLEGGGQLVRVALALSAITITPIRIHSIRANRAPKHNKRSNKVEGGLKESHLAALEWLAKQTNARVDGAEVGSRDIVFKARRRLPLKPKKPNDSNTEWTNIFLKKPGSVWLIFQALFPYILFGCEERKMVLVLRGGTNVDKSMSGEFVVQVLLPTLRKIGVKADVVLETVRRGWAGNAPEIGEVKITIDKGSKESMTLGSFEVVERGDIEKLVLSVVASPDSLRERIIERVETLSKERIGVSVEVEIDEDSGDDRRLYVLLVAHTTNDWRLGRDFLGSGAAIQNDAHLARLIDGCSKRVIDDLQTEIGRGGCVDEHLQDQLGIFQALAKGQTVVDAGQGQQEGTLHTQTVRWVCEEVLQNVKFGADGSCGIKKDASSLAEELKDLEL